MPIYEVEVIGLSRDVWRVEADSPEEAEVRWENHGSLKCSQDYQMEATGVVESK